MILEKASYGGQEIVFRLEHMLGRQQTGAEATTAPPIEPYPTGNARLFDIAKIYGGDVVLPPIKKKATPRSPPREKSKASLVGAGKSGKTVGGFASLADVEAERLDIIRRKNEREMALLIQKEEDIERRTAEAEFKVARAKAAEAERNRRRKEESERQRLEQEARLNLRRSEEASRDAERALAAKRQFEIEQAALEEKQKQAQEAIRLAGQREAERIQRIEQLKAQTAAILAEQVAEVERKRVEMQVKEKERAAVAAQRKRESARQAQEKREAFEKRIARARERAAEAEAEKRREFELRELAAQARSDALAAAKEEEAALRAQIEEEREAQRAAVSAEAAAAAELRINALLEKQLKFEEREKHLQAQREQETVERARRAEQAEEERKLKLEHLMRWREEETAKLEVKIDEAAQRTIALNEQKRQLVMARKVSSVRAQLARQNMKEEMEQARRKRWAAAHPGSPFDLARKAQNRPFGVKSAPNSPRNAPGHAHHGQSGLAATAGAGSGEAGGAPVGSNPADEQ